MRNRTSFLAGLPVHIVLIIITSIISLISFILLYINQNYIDYIALRPISIMQGQYLWTIVLHMFVHGGFGHLFMNMFVLFSLGSLTERIIGKKRFLWLYILSGLFAGILSVLLAYYFGYGFFEKLFGNPGIYMVGASGAIFSIAGLLMVLLPKLRFSIIFLPFFSLPAYVMVPAVLFLTWFLSVVAGLPVGNVAHFGGFVIGLIYGFFLRTKYPHRISMLQRYFR